MCLVLPDSVTNHLLSVKLITFFLPSPVIIHGRHRVFGLCVIKIVSMKSYRLLTGISPSFQVRCRWEHR